MNVQRQYERAGLLLLRLQGEKQHQDYSANCCMSKWRYCHAHIHNLPVACDCANVAGRAAVGGAGVYRETNSKL
jgi:hypothetical protein